MKIDIQSILNKQQILLRQMKEIHPLIHCITNYVTVNDVANLLTAMEASPIMAHHISEVADISAGAKAILLNLGATEYFQAMEISLQAVSSKSIPIVLDPVGVGSSIFRRNQARKWIEDYPISCIRGNASEIKALAGNINTAHGVDVAKKDHISIDNIHQYTELIQNYAKETKALVVISGEVDMISDGKSVYTITGGSAWMKKITGSGCMSSGMMAAFMAVEPSLESILCASGMMCMAAQSAELKKGGAASFKLHLLDAISLFTTEHDQIKISKII